MLFPLEVADNFVSTSNSMHLCCDKYKTKICYVRKKAKKLALLDHHQLLLNTLLFVNMAPYSATKLFTKICIENFWHFSIKTTAYVK